MKTPVQRIGARILGADMEPLCITACDEATADELVRLINRADGVNIGADGSFSITYATRDREVDRLRFHDARFNAWLDETVTENGEFTVWDMLTSTDDAWAAWSSCDAAWRAPK